jgi:nucleoside permease NupC
MARSRLRRLIVALLAALGVALLSFVGLAAVVGLSRAVNWVSHHFFPMAVLLGAVFVMLALYMGVVKRLPLVKRLPKGNDFSNWWK